MQSGWGFGTNSQSRNTRTTDVTIAGAIFLLTFVSRAVVVYRLLVLLVPWYV